MNAEDLYEALSKTKPAYLEESEAPERRRQVPRGLLFAAAVALVGGATALAVSFSLKDAARMDMGVSGSDPIPEWTEYESSAPADTAAEPVVELTSSMCSGSQLYAYLSVSPIDAQTAAGLTDGSLFWDFGSVMPQGWGHSLSVYHVAYDAETQTALAKLHLSGELLSHTDEIEFTLALERSLEDRVFFDPVVIPVTQSQSLSAPVELAVENTEAATAGTITGISVSAASVGVTLEIPSLSDWAAAQGLSMEDADAVIDITDSYFGSWINSISEFLSGAELHYSDGTSELIADMPSPYAGAWISDDPDLSDGTLTVEHVTVQAIDLRTVEKVVIAGVSYPLTFS